MNVEHAGSHVGACAGHHVLQAACSVRGTCGAGCTGLYARAGLHGNPRRFSVRVTSPGISQHERQESSTSLNLQEADAEGATALHFAASGGHSQALAWLLLHGAELSVDNGRSTPLHDAAENGHLECCQILLVHGANVSARDSTELTPADLAGFSGFMKCAKYLHSVELMSLEGGNGTCDSSFDPTADSGLSSPITTFPSDPTLPPHHQRVTPDDLSKKRLKSVNSNSRYNSKQPNTGDYYKTLDSEAEVGAVASTSFTGAKAVAKESKHPREASSLVTRSLPIQGTQNNPFSGIFQELSQRESMKRQASAEQPLEIEELINVGQLEPLPNVSRLPNEPTRSMISPPPPPHLPTFSSSPQPSECGGSRPPSAASSVKSFNMMSPNGDNGDLLAEIKAFKSLRPTHPTKESAPVSPPPEPSLQENQESLRSNRVPREINGRQEVITIGKASTPSTPATRCGSQADGPSRMQSLVRMDSVDVDSLIPNIDEQGRYIPEWRRQMMVRKLQAKMQEEEKERNKFSTFGFGFSSQSWHYCDSCDVVLGPFGELLTEKDIQELEQQVERLQLLRDAHDVESKLDVLEREILHLLPAPPPLLSPPAIQLDRRFLSKDGGLDSAHLPIWCSRISGLLRSMAFLVTGLITNGTSQPSKSKTQPAQRGDNLTTIDSTYILQNVDEQENPTTTVADEMVSKDNTTENSCITHGSQSRSFSKDLMQEMHHYGVSVRSLKASFEPQVILQTKTIPKSQTCAASDRRDDTNIAEIAVFRQPPAATIRAALETRKVRTVLLFLGHWKKALYSGIFAAEQENSEDVPASAETSDDERLFFLLRQRQAVSRLIGHWRRIIFHVPKVPLQNVDSAVPSFYSPEQFLPPASNGSPVSYDSLSLDLFLLGYFRLLEMEMPPSERKARHLLCFEMFDQLASHGWETVREFHKAVSVRIATGQRTWDQCFDDLRQEFFGEAHGTASFPALDSRRTSEVSLPSYCRDEASEENCSETPLPTASTTVKSPRHSDSPQVISELGEFSSEEICRYIDRSFSFWKEKEAELFEL
uniref:Espin like n=1 Tax=Eptatretus burgeri TaxID=7764 RepID=A0A8C4NEB4_EPTBU